ncbi:exo-alpha-sialidase [Aureibaculum sp. A20]|uniref:exo-alpha-sialidase n=1 Tax=Aureibaculum flavum TaxID=2795986 RepID=A0ABS0WUU1_9FLAO|nr:sialidase family protein [Aureibaculum flavum]MBJ2175774.1 exo-alpha-sialidase [Aureibaculum flavum]
MSRSNKIFINILLFIIISNSWGQITSDKEFNNAQENKILNYLFKSDSEDYKCFRIPAIVTTNEGTLLAFAEGRKKGCSDTGNIDLVMKRSEDNGNTWSKLTVIWDDGDNVCGNPAPVVDKVTGAIHLLSTWNLGEDHESEIIAGKSKDTRRIFSFNSIDDGKSWSMPNEITKSVKKQDWTWYATGPVHGIQLEYGKNKGRLIIPSDHIEGESKKYYSHVIYSDDHGMTWQLGGRTNQDQVNECTIVELSDGTLMLNMRNYDRTQKARKIAISTDGGASWEDIYSDNYLVEPICQASLLKVSKNKESDLYFLNPADENKRENMTLKMSRDNGETWSVVKTIYLGASAYSDLTLLLNGNLGLFYEAGNESPYEGIVFEVVKL